VKYVGSIGDDERGRVQIESLRSSGINLDDVQVRKNCPNQTAYILIDQAPANGPVLWQRAECLRLEPSEISEAMITQRPPAAYRWTRHASG